MSNIHSLRPKRQSAIPDVIFVLLILNGLGFAAQFLISPAIWAHFMLWPLGNGSPFGPWQLLTYAFLHDPTGFSHILFNMFGLWMFGRDIEYSMGSARFLTYYLTCVVGAAVVQLVVATLSGSMSPTLGASGGVFGVLLAYGMAFPNRTVMLLIPPIPMRAKYFVLIYGAMTLFFGFSGYSPGVAHFAHLGGMLFGFALIMYWRHGRRLR